MLAGVEDFASKVNGIPDALDGSDSARLERGAVHDDGVELNATIPIEMRADSSVENNVIFEDSDCGFNSVERRAILSEYFATGFEGALDARAAIRDGSIGNVPCSTVDDEREVLGIHVRMRIRQRGGKTQTPRLAARARISRSCDSER